MERMAHADLSEDEACEIIRSPEHYRQLVDGLRQGKQTAAGTQP
jgi:hypothetical protein